MADVVKEGRTSLSAEDVIIRAVQFFSTENWRPTSQTVRAATFQGKPSNSLGHDATHGHRLRDLCRSRSHPVRHDHSKDVPVPQPGCDREAGVGRKRSHPTVPSDRGTTRLQISRSPATVGRIADGKARRRSQLLAGHALREGEVQREELGIVLLLTNGLPDADGGVRNGRFQR